MFPKLFDLPVLNIPINSYGFAIMVGFLLGIWIAVRRAKPLGIDTDILLDVGIIGMIFGILGAKINYILQYPQDFPDTGKASVFLLGDGGYSPIGGLLLGPIPYLVWWWRKRSDEKIRLYSWQSAALLITTLVFAFLGCRGWYLWQHKGLYDWKVFESWQSGFVWYGGLLAGIPAAVLYMMIRRQSIARIADILSPSVMLGLGFGRIGCFLNGCCFGGVCKESFPLAVKYPKTAAGSESLTPAWDTHVREGLIKRSDPTSLPVYPAQLFETVACFAMFFILSWYWKKKQKNNGETILLMCVLYGIWRFSVEFLRGDPGREKFGALGFTYSQTIALAMVVACAVWFYFVRRRAPKTEVAATSKP